MTGSFTYQFDTPVYKGTTTIRTGHFINGVWIQAMDPKAVIPVVNPTTGETITNVAAGATEDVHTAVLHAIEAYKRVWGLNSPGTARSLLLNVLADLVEEHADELAAIEALNVGKPFHQARNMDVKTTIELFRYYAGWADKVEGKSYETDEKKLAYTRKEPFGVVGLIVPWNFPLLIAASKLAPALASGNSVVLKPSEVTPLSTLKLCEYISAAGFPDGVVNVINGYGDPVGVAIARHANIGKVSFTGSTRVGHQIMRASSETNLRPVTLELGGKSPTIVFDDADLKQAVKWAAQGLFYNSGQACIAGSRIYVHAGIYQDFLDSFTETVLNLEKLIGNPFAENTQQGPLVSAVHFNRVMDYIKSGEAEGATIHTGGTRRGTEGYFITPTIFTGVTASMKIMREEIFGPVGAIMMFTTESEVVEAANMTEYGLAANVFSQNVDRALRVAHRLESGSIWVNSAGDTEIAVPFGGYKQSGIGREMGQHAIDAYTRTKAVHVNIGHEL
ncbi:putative aldehyde dehydrogenase family protein [Lyophyllum shimeji]|uniref:Aldehyde dehydrogenase family protein n=1 Tax=Lyophyllum shimeji TaxID=47721 RepID=A0A9P3UU75_LYOSH|nr:putative aldehyde dehydrogenase family protein [Lyophyllum shimeji]